MVLPEVEKRRSGAADVAGIASTRQARRESHGKIFTPLRHSLREDHLSSGAGWSDSSTLESPFSRSQRSSGEAEL